MPRVLLVEPDPARRDLVAMAIRRARHEVRSTPDAHAAAELARECRPEIVVATVDACARGLAELAAGLHGVPGGRSPALIAILPAGTHSVAAIRAALHAGAIDALPCPDAPEEIVAAIDAVRPRADDPAPHRKPDELPGGRVMDALARVAGAALLVRAELADSAALAAADGGEAMAALDRRWQERIAALVPEQAIWWSDGPGRATVVLPPSTPAPNALLAALAGTGQPPVQVGGRELRLRASIGALRIDPAVRGADPASLLARAEHALRLAREAPPPCVHMADGSDAERALADMQLATQVQHALERGSFRLVYQPRVHVPDGHALGAEALLRWTLPGTGEPVAPERLLAVAEDAGLLDEVAGWALREACRRAAAWTRAGVELPVSVNVASCQLRRGNLPDEVHLALREAGIPGRMLALEVRESSSAWADEAVLAQLEEVRVAGVRIVVDDFGTGVAGVGLLRGRPIDEVKLDRSLVARLPGSSEDRAVVDAAVRHARRNGIACSAEGIEDAAQWACVAEAGVTVAQGWLMARPMDGDAVPAFVRQGRRAWERPPAAG